MHSRPRPSQAVDQQLDRGAIPEDARYDLGLVEFLFLIGLAALFGWLDRSRRPAEFFFGLYGVTYGLFRVWHDTLHIQPFRFFGGATAVLIGLAEWLAMAWFAPVPASAVAETPVRG